MAIVVLLFVTAQAWQLLIWFPLLKWLYANDVTLRRTVFFLISLFGIWLAEIALHVSGLLPSKIHFPLLLVAQIIAPILLLRRMFQLSVLKSFAGLVIHDALIWGSVAVMVLFTLKPYILSLYQIPTNSMAPTLLGRHQTGTCNVCSERGYCSAPHRETAFLPTADLMICRHFHEFIPTSADGMANEGDRIIALPFLKPRRWDIAVFQLPSDPETTYVKRLVGLPNETIVIKDGDVWADGVKLQKPDFMSELQYQAEVDGWSEEVWGSPASPAMLRDGEYFFLGDFQSRANDARLWRTGAPDHPPYAVPESHLRGVVTHIVWPPERIRTFR